MSLTGLAVYVCGRSLRECKQGLSLACRKRNLLHFLHTWACVIDIKRGGYIKSRRVHWVRGAERSEAEEHCRLSALGLGMGRCVVLLLLHSVSSGFVGCRTEDWEACPKGDATSLLSNLCAVIHTCAHACAFLSLLAALSLSPCTFQRLFLC